MTAKNSLHAESSAEPNGSPARPRPKNVSKAAKTKARARPDPKSAAPSEPGSVMVPITFRMTERDRDALNAEAVRLNVSISTLLNIRVGATAGLTLAMIEIDKMLRVIDHTAQEFAVVQPQLDDMWNFIQGSDRALNKLSDDVRAGEMATGILSSRLVDLARARGEAGDIIERLVKLEWAIHQPGDRMAAAIERLAEMMAKLKG